VDSILEQIISFDGIREQYFTGTKSMEDIDPDAYITDYDLIKRDRTEKIQAVLFRDYHNNLLQYQEWHKYFLLHQPPALVVWGKNDPIFIAPGAEAYKKDLPKAEIHLVDGGHFALEEYHAEIAEYIRLFLSRNGIE
jgi:pimeloyl-ACP methyl ester carboxylesterase